MLLAKKTLEPSAVNTEEEKSPSFGCLECSFNGRCTGHECNLGEMKTVQLRKDALVIVFGGSYVPRRNGG